MYKKIFVALSIFFLFTQNLYSERWYLTVAAIFQNEASYLKEWLEFHKLVGVEHFFLINNLSDDNYREVLHPYIINKEVTLINWPHRTVDRNWGMIQMEAYNSLLKSLIGVARWVAFLDLDEFLVPVKKDNLQEILRDYEDFGGVAVNWQFYGTSNVDRIPKDKLLIETLLHRAPETDLSQRAIKSIINPRCVSESGQHNFIYKEPYSQVDTAKTPFEGPASPIIRYDVMKIAHYWTRDNNYFENFKIQRREQVGKRVDVYARRDSANKVRDTSMLRFVPRLREKVFG